MYPGTYSSATPDKPAALIADTGEALTYRELEERSVRLAHVLYDAGLRPGDCVALLSENNLRVFEVYWAAIRSGLYITAVNHHLSPDEVAYIVNDSGAAALVASCAKQTLALEVAARVPQVTTRLAFGGQVPGYASYEGALDAASDVPFDDQPHGATMLYSSGTTGTPKGVRPPLPGVQVNAIGDPMVPLVKKFFNADASTVYLSPAPLYHAAPLRWAAAIQVYGGTVVMLSRFDAENCLRAIEHHRVTHAQFVPTMFVRMLQLPDEARSRYDLSSLRVAVHAAAPCPVEVKQKMIDWWGPILAEYYAGTEGIGMTFIDSPTWLQRPGSVGRSVLGTLRICDDIGDEVPPGVVGTVYVERDALPFTYHNDPGKTRAAQHPKHETWTTMGDIGYVDADGFLYLTDRKAFTIISGGVNIYPQEIENVLTLHPAVYDLAVVGVPDREMGQSVKAFIELRPGYLPGPELEQQIIGFVKDRIASFKAPRSVAFITKIPRTATGKLLKRELNPAEAK